MGMLEARTSEKVFFLLCYSGQGALKSAHTYSSLENLWNGTKTL
jgi:hypothetical protein